MDRSVTGCFDYHILFTGALEGKVVPPLAGLRILDVKLYSRSYPGTICWRYETGQARRDVFKGLSIVVN
jgi:hypothetical protein